MKETARFLKLTILLIFLFISACYGSMQSPGYQYKETKDLVSLVEDAAILIENRGEAAFLEFKKEGSRWRHADKYIFVLDTNGNMIVHPDAQLEGKNQFALRDINGKLIIKGFIREASGYKNKNKGWFHYQWPEPGSIFPRWKSTFVESAYAPSGKKYIVASGLYNMKMERAFVVDKVNEAAEQIEKNEQAAFRLLRDPSGEFLFKDTYIFVIAPDGTDLVNPGFTNLEGRNLLDLEDTQGKKLIREMLDVVKSRGSGWVDYMWPKPAEYTSARKSSYVTKAKVGDNKWVLVGCGVYLEGAPKERLAASKMTAMQVVDLVTEAAAILEKEGEASFTEFRKNPSKWFHDDTYLFIWDIKKGVRVFHAADPGSEGQKVIDLKDARGRPIGRMFIDAVSSPKGQGWVHYLWPRPQDIFPVWKSAFLKRVVFPSGREYLVGCGIYNMKIEKKFIIDVVDEAAALITEKGRASFKVIRDKNGPFVFLDTYVFVDSPDGVELVNPAFPSIEGKNVMGFKDASGKYMVREYIKAALTNGSAWVDYMWPKPGELSPSKKHTYVRKVKYGNETFIVGSGAYLE